MCFDVVADEDMLLERGYTMTLFAAASPNRAGHVDAITEAVVGVLEASAARWDIVVTRSSERVSISK